MDLKPAGHDRHEHRACHHHAARRRQVKRLRHGPRRHHQREAETHQDPSGDQPERKSFTKNDGPDHLSSGN